MFHTMSYIRIKEINALIIYTYTYMGVLANLTQRVFKTLVNIHTAKHPFLFIFPIVGWAMWFTKYIKSQVWFSASIGTSVLAIVNNCPIVVKKLYGSSHTYEDLTVKHYIERKLVDAEDQRKVQREYEGVFMIVATWVLSLSSFLLVHLRLFKFDELPYTWAQIWSILSGAIAGVNMCQNLILRTTLSLLVKNQRTKFERIYSANAELKNHEFSLSDEIHHIEMHAV